MKILVLLFLFFLSCSVQNTVSIVEYTKPFIEEVRYDGENIHFKILSYVGTTDISNYNIFLATDKEQLEKSQEKNKKDLNGFVKFTEMDNFFTNTQQVSFKSGYQEVNFSNLIKAYPKSDTIYLAFACWGYQSAIARVYNNNGWIQSSYSDIVTFHPSQFTNFVLTNINFNSKQSGFTFKPTGVTILDERGKTEANYQNDFYFSVATKDGVLQIMFFTGAQSSSVLQPLGFMSRNQFESQIELPSDNYLDKGQGVLIKQGMAYALKNTANNIYMKIFVVSISKEKVGSDGEEVTANVLFFYSTKEARNKF